MSDVTDKLASTYEQSQQFVNTSQEKLQKAKDLTHDVIGTADQAMQDLQSAQQALSTAQSEIMSLVHDVGTIVSSIQEGDIPSIAMAVKKTAELVAGAVPKYGSAVSTVTAKASAYQNAVARNKQALESF